MTQNTERFTPPLPSTGSRSISFRSKGSCRSEIVAGNLPSTGPVRIQCESRLEDRVATILLAEVPLLELRDQYPCVTYTGSDGLRKSHTFDFLAVLRTGMRIAIAVKPFSQAMRRNLAAELSAIAAVLQRRVANEVTLITDRDINKERAMNASRYLSFQKTSDPEADAWLAEHHDALPHSQSIGSIIEQSGMKGRMFRAIFRAIYHGPLTADLTQPISYNTTVFREPSQ